MSFFANLETLQIINRMDLQDLFPNISFPPDIINSNIEDLGWTILEFDPEPSLNTLEYLDWGQPRREGHRVVMSWVVVSPTEEQWLTYNTDKLNALLRQANAQISALQGRVDTINDAIELDEALQSEIDELVTRQADLKSWKQYRIQLGRVSTQEGWPPNPVWPLMPTPYTNEMSLGLINNSTQTS